MNRFTPAKRLTRLLPGLVGVVWALLSVIAIGGLYFTKLLREDVAWYGGKSIPEQRTKVLERAGTPLNNLEDALKVIGHWPDQQGYAAQGDFNKLSYVKYLLIPRLPGGSDTHVVRWNDGSLEVEPSSASPGTSVTGTSWDGCPPSPLAFLLSMATVLGWAIGLRRTWPQWGLSIPEGSVLAALVLMTLTLGSRLAFQTASNGFLAFVVLGVLLLAASAARRPYGAALSQGRDQQEDTVALPLVHQRVFWAVLLLTCGWALAKAVIVVPDDWDAWAIWGAKAKVLALGVGPLTDVQYFGHSDYPLLWPALWAFTGWISGGWEEHWARAWGALMLGLTALEIRNVTWRRTRSFTATWVAPMLLLSCPKVLLFASWGYAEPALWLALTCAASRLIRWQEQPRLTHAVMAGTLCAAAAFTKNEGLLFTLLFMAAFLWSPGRWRALLGFGLPFACLMTPWLVWKSAHLPDGPRVFSEASFSLEHLRYMQERCPEAIASIGSNWASLTSWNLALPIALALTGYTLCVGTRHARLFAAIPACALLALFLVILNSPDPVYWQVGTAWDRLTAQVMPLMALALSYGVCPQSREPRSPLLRPAESCS